MKEGSGKRLIACLAVTIGIVVTIMLIIVILAFTVFKPKHIISKVDSIAVENMDVGFNVFTMSLTLNVTLDVFVLVTNPNKVGLRYYDGYAQLNHRGQQIGEAHIPDGNISPKETKGVNVTLTLMADRMLSSEQIFTDIASGGVPLNTFMRISGEVNLLGLFKFHGNSTTTCDFVINASNKIIDNRVCHTKKEI